jgi:all-trans-retinol 13,14-reductase
VVDGEERLAAPTVIANVHPKALLDLVPAGVFRPAFTNRVRELKDGIGTFNVYLKTSADLSSFGAHNVYRLTGEDVDQAYTDLTAGPGRRPCIYYTVPSARDRRHQGEHVVVALGFMWYEDVARWAGTRTFKRPEDYDAFKMESAAGVVAVLEEDLPALRDHILTVEASTPLTNLHYTRNSGGAAYGIYHDRAQAMQALQPRTRVTGLLLTGHAVLLPGITGVALTAFYTCAYLLGFTALREGLASA